MTHQPDGEILIIFVDNQFGVLTRITAMIRREGFNMHTLTVAPTADPQVSRVTIHLDSRQRDLSQLLHRLSRMDCVRRAQRYSPDTQVSRGLLLAKLPAQCQRELEALAGEYPFRLVSRDARSILVEFSGDSQQIGGFASAIAPMNPIEVARTGLVTMEY